MDPEPHQKRDRRGNGLEYRDPQPEKENVFMKIEIDPKARNEEKLWDIAEYLEAVKDAVVEIEADYDEEKGISDVLTDALEYLDDVIDALNEAADEIEVRDV